MRDRLEEAMGLAYKAQTGIEGLLEDGMCGIENELRQENLVAALVHLEVGKKG